MGLFGIFGSKRLSTPINLGTVGTDMHSHLIPGIDDGARSLEDSVTLIKEMQGLGYKKLITTPHIQQEFYKNTPEIINSGLTNLKEVLRAENIQVEIQAAAEYLLDDGFNEKFEKGDLLTFGKKYVLIELSYYNPHPDLKGIVFRLQVDGYQVILAHPERYSYWFNDWNKFTELKDRGVLFQLNLVSLAGFYPEPVQKMAEKFIDEGLIDLVGSDMHNVRYMDALKACRLEKSLEKLVSSGKLINNSL